MLNRNHQFAAGFQNPVKFTNGIVPIFHIVQRKGTKNKIKCFICNYSKRLSEVMNKKYPFVIIPFFGQGYHSRANIKTGNRRTLRKKNLCIFPRSASCI